MFFFTVNWNDNQQVYSSNLIQLMGLLGHVWRPLDQWVDVVLKCFEWSGSLEKSIYHVPSSSHCRYCVKPPLHPHHHSFLFNAVVRAKLFHVINLSASTGSVLGQEQVIASFVRLSSGQM